ncbi:MAG TPA: hypothetical protein VGO48_01260 [Conexibacter sp.]|jgi:hypothetical protein|nr:hypothetical protein [Conexibacter sp.]
MFLRVAIGLALVCVVLLYGYTGGSGMDGPCVHDASFLRSIGATSFTVRSDEIVPLVGTCHVYARDGQMLGSRTYPEAQYWLYVLIAFLSPFAVAAAYGSYRSRVSGPTPLGRLIDRCFPRTGSRHPPRRDGT